MHIFYMLNLKKGGRKVNVFVIPNKGKILEEIRPAYFLKAFHSEPLDMRIISFGRCNYACPYCKRGGSTKDDSVISGSIKISKEELFQKIDDAILKKQVIRLSGGDPVCYPELSLEILKYAKERNAITSVAHNGSGPDFVKKIIPYLDFASIDFKASNENELSVIANLNLEFARKAFLNTIQTISLLTNSKIRTDVRTCIFESTTMEQLEKIAQILDSNCDKNFVFWTLRTYSPVETCQSKPKNHQEMEAIAITLSGKHADLLIGLRNKWEPDGFSFFKNGQKLEFDDVSMKKGSDIKAYIQKCKTENELFDTKIETMKMNQKINNLIKENEKIKTAREIILGYRNLIISKDNEIVNLKHSIECLQTDNQYLKGKISRIPKILRKKIME